MAVVERGGGLVGREAVLGVAETALDEMLSGAGQLLLFTGEPGIGKSALLTEVARRGARRGSRVLRGVCWRGDGAPPYWPWTQVLRGMELDQAGYGEAGRLLAGQPVGGFGSAKEAADAHFRLLGPEHACQSRQLSPAASQAAPTGFIGPFRRRRCPEAGRTTPPRPSALVV
jgi:hypothetical protein